MSMGRMKILPYTKIERRKVFMDFYLQYVTPGGRMKERFFAKRSDMNAFILSSKCKVVMWREL